MSARASPLAQSSSLIAARIVIASVFVAHYTNDVSLFLASLPPNFDLHEHENRFIPNKWYHATFNDEETVNISFLDNKPDLIEFIQSGAEIHPSRMIGVNEQ